MLNAGNPMRGGVAAGLATAVLLLWPGGGAASEPELLAGSRSEALLLLPLNVVLEMPAELAEIAPVVWDDFAGYLKGQGRKLKTARLSDARRLWRESIRRARAERERGSSGEVDALRLLVEALARYADFGAVIVPSLVVREAPIRGRRAAWDGVEQSVEFRADSPETRKLTLLVRFEGVAPAASLHVVILDSEGRKLQEKTRGLELLSAVRVREDPHEPYVYERRRDLFQDPEAVRRSVAHVLAPFVPPADPR